MAKYFMELSLVDYACIAFLPSEIAAASLYIAMKAADDLEWTPTMEYYSMYSESKLQPCARRIAFLITKTLDGSAKHKVREQQSRITSSSGDTRHVYILGLATLKQETEIMEKPIKMKKVYNWKMFRITTGIKITVLNRSDIQGLKNPPFVTILMSAWH